MKFDPTSHDHVSRLRILDNFDSTFLATDEVELKALSEGKRPKPGEAFDAFISHSRLSVAAPLLNMMQAGPMLYQHITAQYLTTEALKKNLISYGGIAEDSPLIRQLCNMQDAMLLAQQAAREGISKVGKMLDRESGV